MSGGVGGYAIPRLGKTELALTTPEKRIMMAKRVVGRWLHEHASPEYRLTVYIAGDDMARVPGLLRAFRNGKAKLASVPLEGNIGMAVGFDHITVWGSSRTTIASLDKWFLARGYETTGMW